MDAGEGVPDGLPDGVSGGMEGLVSIAVGKPDSFRPALTALELGRAGGPRMARPMFVAFSRSERGRKRHEKLPVSSLA